MSRSRHSSTEYFGSPSEWSPNSSTRLPVKSLIGEIELNASISPSEMNHLNDAFCSSIRSGRLRTSGIFANENRLLVGPGSSGSSTVNASSGTTNEALAIFCALITFPFAAGSATGVAAFLLRDVLGFSAVVLEAMYRLITYSSAPTSEIQKRQGLPMTRERVPALSRATRRLA